MTKPNFVFTESSEDSCADKKSSCNYWANIGYCTEKFTGYMFNNCKKSCGLCPGKWEGEWIQFMFHNGNVIECSLDGPTGGDPWRTAALNCNPIGMVIKRHLFIFKVVRNMLKSVHFKKTVARSSFLSKLWHLLLLLY